MGGGEKRDLRNANSEDPDQPAHPRSLVRIFCSPNQYRDLVEDKGLIAKILTPRVVAQTSLGLRHSGMPLGSFRQVAAQIKCAVFKVRSQLMFGVRKGQLCHKQKRRLRLACVSEQSNQGLLRSSIYTVFAGSVSGE